MSDNMLPNGTPIIIEMTPEGKDGLDGVSVVGFGMISQEGKVKTYRFTLSNGDHFDFSVADGEDPVLEWGEITGTLTDQTDLAEALTAIRTEIASKAEASDVYDKTAIDAALSAIDNTLGQIVTALSTKADSSSVYTKTEADALLDGKANTGDSYTKSEDDALLAQKANADAVYTKTEADALLASKADADGLADAVAEIAVIDSAIDGISANLANKANASDLNTLANRVSADEQTIAGKADANAVYTKTESDALLAQKADTADVTSALAQKADADDLADAVADIADLDLAKASVIVNTASGAMGTITDGAEAPVKSLTVGIDPVQDLHGYDAPWPAGGGKNLFDATRISTAHNGITATVSSDGTITLNGTAGNGNSYLVETGIGATSTNGFVWSAFNPVAESGVHIVLRDSQGGYFGDSSLNAINKTVIMSTYNDCNSLSIYVTAGTQLTNFVVKPLLEKGSAPSPFSPYSNVCPITGHTSATVTRTGKNLYPIAIGADLWSNFQGGSHSNNNGELVISMSSTLYSGVYSSILTSQIIKLSKMSVLASYSVDVKASESTEIWVGYNGFGHKKFQIGTTYQRLTFTGIQFSGTQASFNIYNGTTSAVTVYLKDFLFELGSSATPYEPYQCQTISVTFPSEAGTVYGGYVDVTNRTLTVTQVFFTNKWKNGANSTVLENFTRKQFTAPYIANYPNFSRLPLSNIAPYKARFTEDSLHFYINNVATSNAIMFLPNDTDGETDIEFCYELATPLTYQLTPQQMTLLLGENHIWADTGDVTVEYRADTKLFIQALTKPTEDDMVANANIASGTFFMVGNNLYLSSTAISAGEKIVVGTNCTALSLADALNQLNQ